MSQAEIERFVSDMKSNPELLEKVKNNAAGIDSVVAIAKDEGYDITADEAKSYIQSQTSADLSDSQLEALAGGKGHHSTQVSAVQTAVSVTTEATTAETSTSVVVEAEAVLVLT